MQLLIEFILSLIDLLKAMSPYLLLGFLFAGILKVWFPQRWIDRYMGKNNWRSVINTAILGIPLPLCSCGVIPTGISFYRNGASKGSSVSFLISTPQTGVDSIMVTYSLLGLPFAIIRVIVALITGVLGGGLTNFTAQKDIVNTSKATDSCESDKMGTKQGIKGVLHYGFYEFLMDIAKWLVIGILIAAILAVIIPDDFFTTYVDNEPLSMLMVLFASVPLYLCATSSVPIAAVLMMKGLSPGAALVLLMAGPATNAATITVIKKVFGNKTLFSYLGSIILGALVFGMIINNYLPREWFIMSEYNLHHTHHDELAPKWLQISSALLLVGLIINGYIHQFIKRKKLRNNIKIQSETVKASILQSPPINNTATQFSGFSITATLQTKIFIVEGMTCSHCKQSVEQNLLKTDTIQNVNADPQNNTVTIEASQFDIGLIKKTVERLGYSFKGEKSS